MTLISGVRKQQEAPGDDQEDEGRDRSPGGEDWTWHHTGLPRTGFDALLEYLCLNIEPGTVCGLREASQQPAVPRL